MLSLSKYDTEPPFDKLRVTRLIEERPYILRRFKNDLRKH